MRIASPITSKPTSPSLVSQSATRVPESRCRAKYALHHCAAGFAAKSLLLACLLADESGAIGGGGGGADPPRDVELAGQVGRAQEAGPHGQELEVALVHSPERLPLLLQVSLGTSSATMLLLARQPR